MRATRCDFDEPLGLKITPPFRSPIEVKYYLNIYFEPVRMNYITSCLLSNEESGFLLFAVKSGNLKYLKSLVSLV